MPKLRFQGTEQVYVSALDRLVEPDEVVDVPDDLVHDPDNPTNEAGELVGLVWPESLWAEVSSKAKSKAAKADKPDDTQED